MTATARAPSLWITRPEYPHHRDQRDPGTAPGQPDTALVERIRHTLAALGDPQRAAGQQAYMKSAMPYLGVTMGRVRAPSGPCVGGRRTGDVGGDAASPLGRRQSP